ncbi:MAG TPA: hypothetical protein VMF50_13260 [Candidatus Binataceae bacterium]|nr:hypothetical protein [Candidatus Binataceae bacterium]
MVPVEGAADVVQSLGSTAGGIFTIGSTTRLNGADANLATAQTRLTLGQFTKVASDQQRLARERVVTARLLRQMAKTYDDPLLETMAEWVEGGGDPDFSFKYALVQVSDIEAQDHMLAKHGSSTLIVPPAVPKVKAFAQSPRISVMAVRS